MPSVCFVAGDPSGDAHAAHLIAALKSKCPDITCTGLGGSAMEQAGMSLLDDLTKSAAIGPFDAARHFKRLKYAKKLLQEHLVSQKPNLVVLVDFGDYNLPTIAPMVKRLGLPVIYFISPQLWAWGKFRLRYVKRYVDRMIVFFPFEETFYQRAGVPVTWVGHPLIDRTRPTLSKDDALKRFGLNPWRMTVGLLPGSRKDEVRRHLPLLFKAAKHITRRMPGVQFLVPRASGLERRALDQAVEGVNLALHIADGPIADALKLMEAAIVTSGTATLETAVCGVPMVVVYRTSWPTYLFARAVVRIPNIAMVNVVAGRKVVPEFVQHRAQAKRVAACMIELLRNDERKNVMKAELRSVTEKLGSPGAINRTANIVMEMLAKRQGANRT